MVFTSTSGNDPIRLDHNFSDGLVKTTNFVFFSVIKMGATSGSHDFLFGQFWFAVWTGDFFLGHRGLPAKVASVAAAGHPGRTFLSTVVADVFNAT